MTESLLLLTIVFMLTVALSFIGVRQGGILGVILIGQALYWVISYVLRPAILLLVQPRPSFGDSVADGRIASGGYDTFMPEILRTIVAGLSVYVLIIAFLAFLSRRYVASQLSIGRRDYTDPAVQLQALTAAYTIGWVCRIGTEVLGASAVLDTLSGLAILGAAGLIIFKGDGKNAKFIVGVPIAGELLWSTLSASKTPLIAAVLCVAIRVAILGWTRRRLQVVAGAAAMGVLAFPLLQQLKLTADTASILNQADASYPSMVRPVMPLIRRFDLFSAVTDATLFGPGEWMNITEFWHRAIGGLIPQPLLQAEKIGVGTMWSLEIRSASLGSANRDVSLAEGFIAEGYALNGFLGVTLGAAFMAIVAVLVGRLIRDPRPFAASMGMLLVSYPVLFERGVLGTIEIVGKSAQVAAIFWCIYLLLNSLTKAKSRQMQWSHAVDR